MTLALSIVQATLKTYRDQKATAEKAIAQLDDAQLFLRPEAESNSIASLMKHVGGNLHSRWLDFLTTDGEKPDRNRDGEFEPDEDSAAAIRTIWDRGWATLEASLATLDAADLDKTVSIRGEPMSVAVAMQRSLAHTSHHAGQIIMLAKMIRGSGWTTLTIPKAKRPCCLRLAPVMPLP